MRVVLVEPGFTRTNIDTASAHVAEPDAAYDGARDAAVANIGGQVQKAPDPIGVAKVIERAIASPAFRRMPVGGEAAMLSRLRRFLPAKMVDGAVRKSFGL